MIKAERQDKVRQLLEEQGTVSVKEISDALGVSDMTIRRDLEELEKHYFNSIILDEAQNIKNPNTIKIKTLVRDEILKVKEVKAATVTSVDYNPAKRTATFHYTVTVGEDTFREEVTLYG